MSSVYINVPRIAIVFCRFLKVFSRFFTIFIRPSPPGKKAWISNAFYGKIAIKSRPEGGRKAADNAAVF